MKFYRYLYVGESVANPAKVKWKLKNHIGQLSVYVICLAGGMDQLEIYHCAYLKQKYYRFHPPIIVGLSGSYEEAVELVMQMTKESLETTGCCNIKAYLKKRTEKGAAYGD